MLTRAGSLRDDDAADYPRRVDLQRDSAAWMLAAIAALAAVAAASWRAAEEHRGLDAADFRSVILIAVAVWVAARILQRASAHT